MSSTRSSSHSICSLRPTHPIRDVLFDDSVPSWIRVSRPRSETPKINAKRQKLNRNGCKGSCCTDRPLSPGTGCKGDCCKPSKLPTPLVDWSLNSELPNFWVPVKKEFSDSPIGSKGNPLTLASSSESSASEELQVLDAHRETVKVEFCVELPQEGQRPESPELDDLTEDRDEDLRLLQLIEKYEKDGFLVGPGVAQETVDKLPWLLGGCLDDFADEHPYVQWVCDIEETYKIYTPSSYFTNNTFSDSDSEKRLCSGYLLVRVCDLVLREAIIDLWAPDLIVQVPVSFDPRLLNCGIVSKNPWPCYDFFQKDECDPYFNPERSPMEIYSDVNGLTVEELQFP